MLFSIIAPGTVSVYIPLGFFAYGQIDISSMTIMGIIVLSVGAMIYVACLWNFAIVGQGTPAPVDPPKKLVVVGLYRYTRNPMYIGVLSILFGWTFIFPSIGLVTYTVAVGTCFHLLVVFYEEPHLHRMFGRPYMEYCSRVNRWLFFRHSTAA